MSSSILIVARETENATGRLNIATNGKAIGNQTIPERSKITIKPEIVIRIMAIEYIAARTTLPSEVFRDE